MSIFFSSSGNYFIAMKKPLCYITSSFPLGISGSAKLGAVSKELQRAVYLVKFFIVIRLFHSFFVFIGISVMVFIVLHLTGDSAGGNLHPSPHPQSFLQYL
jgi:hypothetical protein